MMMWSRTRTPTISPTSRSRRVISALEAQRGLMPATQLPTQRFPPRPRIFSAWERVGVRELGHGASATSLQAYALTLPSAMAVFVKRRVITAIFTSEFCR